MPANTGRPPRAELVDIRFRGGAVARGVKPSSYRWTIADPAYPRDYAFDIDSWQPAKS